MQSDRITGLSLNASLVDASGSSGAKTIGPSGANEEFASLDAARAYLCSIRSSIGFFASADLTAALSRAATAYQQFPELVLECPHEDLLDQVASTLADPKTRKLASVIRYFTTREPHQSTMSQLLRLTQERDGWDTFLSGLRLVLLRREVSWRAIEKLLRALQRERRGDEVLELLSAVLEHIPDDRSRFVFEDLLRSLLDCPPSAQEPGSLTTIALAARHRLKRAVPGSTASRPASALVDTAERLRSVLSPAMPDDPRPVVAWASGLLSFGEFLLQWPCNVELPTDLGDADFIKESFRAILLRDPSQAEMQQHMRLMKEGASKAWLVEDLLACEELRRLDRQLRVSLGDCVITEPGKPGNENNPTVTWPTRTDPHSQRT
jgi:hypothetical protein